VGRRNSRERGGYTADEAPIVQQGMTPTRFPRPRMSMACSGVTNHEKPFALGVRPGAMGYFRPRKGLYGIAWTCRCKWLTELYGGMWKPMLVH
jgi:hypothetical protein